MLIRRLAWMAAVVVPLLVVALAFNARQVDERTDASPAPPSQSVPPSTTRRDAKDQRARSGAGVEPTHGSPGASSWSRPSVAAHWAEIEIDGVRVPKPDLSEPYPFAPGRAAGLDVAGTLEVLDRFYGAGLPEGWSVKGLTLPGEGRFELDVDAQGTPMALRGTLDGDAGFANLILDGEPERKLTVPLPPGVSSIQLHAGAALINAAP